MVNNFSPEKGWLLLSILVFYDFIKKNRAGLYTDFLPINELILLSVDELKSLIEELKPIVVG